MPPKADFDLQSAHKFFAADCFNKTWGLIDNADRTPDENIQMLAIVQASLYHWTQREDCTPQNLSVGYWQTSRVFALLGQADNARRYGQLALENGKEAPPFYLGYAYEALARAEKVAGNKTQSTEYLAKAREQAELVSDKDEKSWLTADLDSLG